MSLVPRSYIANILYFTRALANSIALVLYIVYLPYYLAILLDLLKLNNSKFA